MKLRIYIPFFCLLICSAAVFAQDAAKDDVVMRAMKDELARSMKKLQLENLEKPYFISYSVIDSNSAGSSASLGSLTSKVEEQRFRLARIQVRVGSPKLDNHNFFSFALSSGVSSGTMGEPGT